MQIPTPPRRRVASNIINEEVTKMMFFNCVLSIILVDKFFCSLMDKGDREKKIFFLSPISLKIGGVTLFALWIAKASPWLSALSAIVLMGLMVGTAYIWCYSGKTLKQFFWFALLEVIYAFLLAGITSVQVVWPLLYVIASRLPWITCIASVATGAVWTLRRKAASNENYGYAAVVVAAMALVALAAIGAPAVSKAVAIVKASFAAADKATTVNAEETPVATETPASASVWYRFQNALLLEDKDVANDWNFGPDPFVEGKTAEYYLQDFLSRMKGASGDGYEADPALVSATALSLDTWCGTDYVGEILLRGNVSMNDKLNQLKRADAATAVLMKDQKLLVETALLMEKYMSRAKWTLEYRRGFTDMVNMNPDTLIGYPGIVLYESETTEGWCLVGTFQTEKGVREVVFHIHCGYQLVNSAKAMGVTPEKKPASKTSPAPSGGGKSNPTPAPKPGPSPTPTPTPGPSPTPTPGPTKDPSQSNNSGKNDVPGKNQNTSTGLGGRESSQESVISSQDKQEYQQAQQHVQEANNSGQREAGDSIAPSTTTPPDVQDIRNDGAKEIEKPATETKPVESQSGTEIQKDNDGSWSGPTD